MKLARTRADLLFDICNYTLISILVLLVLYPLYFVLTASVTDPDLVYSGKLLFFPEHITWDGYKRLLAESSIWLGFSNSLWYTLTGTAINVVLTITAGYVLSRSDLIGRNVFMFLLVFTMFFGGGLIPSYLLVKELHMLDTTWAMIIPNAVSVFNVIIVRTFFQTNIPGELLESAQMDGCSNLKFFWKIAIPLALPIVAVIVLFYAVGHWNSYFQALIYLKSNDKQPLQIILRNILIMNEGSDMQGMLDGSQEQQKRMELMKYGIIIISSLPVMILYPFLQRYFVKGTLVGSVKG
ncbi:L-arabinose transport system permease protein AraQ [Paenibacillus allorhizoplanae]|uniref:L-arabinose transport system permease protein AraQ n=1 Tax=Paenibacillus allorhizoplanae TaxID=2905648 RepID=A0ABN8G566_9BACL|nr:carbohydrate ABC transporter permease [Paenibacillus allorhizoplanae]CAH1200213.1 L-arabinose transport system permease protein AraQ [Paenibacillus allorhizoplanae]